MKRTEIRRELKEKLKRLGELDSRLRELAMEERRIKREIENLQASIEAYCSHLGQTYALNCPAYKTTKRESFCVIKGLTDLPHYYRFCIGCQIPFKERLTKTLVCKLTGRLPREE